jgi:predicted permease
MLRIVDAARMDLRQAVRRIVRAPVLSFVVIATLALAIAANTTIFSLLKPTVLRKLSAQEPERLVAIGATDTRTSNYSPIYLEVMRATASASSSFAQLGAFSSSFVSVEREGVRVDVGVEGVTPGYFDVLGVRAGAGRVIAAADDPYAAIGLVTEALAQRLFGNGAVIGQSVVVDGRPVEIIGVTSRGFTGTRMDGGDELFLPLAFLRTTVLGSDPKGTTRAQAIIARLADNASIEAARSEIAGRWPAIQSAIASGLPAAQRTAVENQRLDVASFARGFSGTRDRYGASLALVMALAAALLTIGCVNLSGLMLARALTRQHEFAVRSALGAGRARLLQQTLIDGVLLALAALVIAMPMSWAASRLLTSMVSLSRLIPIGKTTPDGEVLLIATVVSISIGVLIGVLPARRAMAQPTDAMLRGRGTAQRIRGTTRGLLVTQVALSMILVVCAGLFVTTLSNLYANDLQERPHPILFTRLGRNPLERGKPLGSPYFRQLQEQLAAIPGVDGASLSESYPAFMAFFGGTSMDTVTLGSAQAPAAADYVTPGFFDVQSIARLQGRDFTWADLDTSPPVVIVNEALARKLSPAMDVVGQRVQIASGPATTTAEIIGVVANATVTNIRERNVAGVYRPLMQDLRRGQQPMAHVRVVGDLATVGRGYVDTIHANRQHIVRGLFTMDKWVDNAVVEQQLIAGMSGVAAILAMTLAAIGLFGLLAYSVSSRVREIGVRMSIGATPREVIVMIVREGMAVVIPGVLIGIPLAIAVAWALRSQLYGVTATSPLTIAAAALVFTFTAALASWLPARRAARIQPSVALRQD